MRDLKLLQGKFGVQHQDGNANHYVIVEEKSFLQD